MAGHQAVDRAKQMQFDRFDGYSDAGYGHTPAG